jgi:hypothetical protein
MIARVFGLVVVALSVLAPLPALGSGTSVTTPVASAPGAPASDVEALRQRAAAFWAARVEGNANAQWDLLEPRGKGRLTALEYAPREGAAKYLAYQVEDATVNGYFATVKVRVLAQPLLPMTGSRKIGPSAVELNDRWVRIGGVWYRSLEQSDQK